MRDKSGGQTDRRDRPLNQVTQFAYDANGNQTNIVDALNDSNSFMYEALNRQSTRFFPDGTSESYGYEGICSKVASTNQAGIELSSGLTPLSLPFPQQRIGAPLTDSLIQ